MTRFTLSVRLIVGFLLVAVMPMAGLAWLYLTTFESTLTDTALQNVSIIADKKTDQINTFINERLEEARLQARRSVWREALQFLGRPAGTADAAQLAVLDQRFRQRLSELAETQIYHDILLMDAQGNVVFSLKSEPELGTNLQNGPYQNSLLAQAYRQAMSAMHTDLTAFMPYSPSGGRVSAFLVTPVSVQGRAIGVLAFQLNLDNLMPVVLDRTGLGETGETALAQLADREVLYTAPLKRINKPPYTYRIPISNSARPMQQALSGNRGSGLTLDYAGIDVVAAWRYLPALRWGMVVKMDSQEALAPARQAVRLTWLAFALFVLLSGGMAWLMGRRMVHAEDSLAAQEARYRAMQGSMTDGVALLLADASGQDFVFVDFNAAGQRITGLSREQVLGQPITRVLPGLEASGLLAALLDTQQTGQTHTLPLVNYQDERLNLWVDADSVRLPGGEMMLVMQDISERRSAQARIEHL